LSNGRERSLPVDAAVAANCSLLVPMRLQALPVPEAPDPDSRWADLTPRYDELDGETPRTLGYELRPTLFDQPPEPPGPGIHLHWTLPAAFTHLDQKIGEAASFPPVPNRWLVVRLWEERTGEVAYRAQVVESDYLGEEGTNPWLTLGGSPREFRAGDKIGRAVDLASYVEQPSPASLTAVAPGNLAFASFYPSCRNVFGFYDEESGPAQRVYSYLVIGWFADPARDPLAGCKDRADWLLRMGKLGWSVPENTKALPTRILCHGAIHGVRWPPTSADVVSNFPQFELAVGSNAVDAIAALVNKRTALLPDLGSARDRLLGELQFAVLQDRPPTARELFSETFTQRRRLTSLRARLHEKTFTALPGGTRWEIDQPGRNGNQATQQNRAVLKLSPQLAGWLSQINQDQRDYDLKQRGLTGLQQEIYFQWHKKRQLPGILLAEAEARQRAEILNRRIAAAEPQVTQQRIELAQLKVKIERTAQAIRAVFDTDPVWRGHVLVARPMPRYWRPNDPSLLMAGVPIPAIQDGAAPLICRVTGQTVSSFAPRAEVADFGYVDAKADDLAGTDVVKEFSSRMPAGIPPGAAELFCETLLLDPGRARVLARIARRKTPAPITEEDLTARIRSVLASRSAGDFTIGSQRADEWAASTAFNAAFSAIVSPPFPWKPVFMIWRVRYLPGRSASAQNNLQPYNLQPWRLDADGVDYDWRGPPPPESDSAAPDDYVDYQGYSPLSDSVGRGLASERPRPAVFNTLPAGSLVVQSIGGFTEALLMHDTATQLPPLQEKSRAIDEGMRQLVGDQYAVAPMAELLATDKFFPIRGGHLALRRLWLVDTFGRARRVVDDDGGVAPSISINHSLAVPGSEQQIRLAPRLAQPSRLLFRWLSAENDQHEFLGDSATEPICGWIIHNRLDKSLLICDAAGRSLGAVQSVVQPGGWNECGIRWAKLPLGPIDPSRAAAALRPGENDIPNRHLRGFVTGLLDLADPTGKATTAAFEDFIGLIASLEDSEPRPSERQGLSALVGRPLALTRASLRLDLLGPPARDQSWSQLEAAGPASFTEVPFEVRLGSRGKGPDGLIGYFPSDDYRLIRLAHELAPRAAGTEHQYFRSNQAVPVTGNPDMPAAMLTLLLDPRLGVHVSSGILPTKVIDLPAELVSEALSRLEVPFLVAPVLGERQADGVPNIPLPSDMPGTWFWTWRPAPNAASEFAKITSETAPARSLFKTMALYEGWLALRQNGAEPR
jgi:hypothetical protein